MSMDHFNFLLAEFEPPPPESGNEVGNISGSLKDEDEIKRFTVRHLPPQLLPNPPLHHSGVLWLPCCLMGLPPLPMAGRAPHSA